MRDVVTGYSNAKPVAPHDPSPGGASEGIRDAVIPPPVTPEVPSTQPADASLADTPHTPTADELADLGRPSDPYDDGTGRVDNNHDGDPDAEV